MKKVIDYIKHFLYDASSKLYFIENGQHFYKQHKVKLLHSIYVKNILLTKNKPLPKKISKTANIFFVSDK